MGKVRSTRGEDTGAVATGFLVDGELIDASLADLPLFLTCNHVVRSPDQVDFYDWSLPSQDALVIFEGMFDDDTSDLSNRFEQVIMFSSWKELNYTLLLLDRWPGPVTDIAIAPQVPAEGDPVIVLGYPGGRGLAVSIEDNQVVAADESRVFYRAPTEGGSSGSLVVNQYWEAVALHERSDQPRSRNGGTKIDAILAHARANFDSAAVSEDAVSQLRATRRASPVARPEVDANRAQLEPDYFSVFISYSHADSAFALRLYDALRASGVRAWMDKHEMLPGDDIYEQVSKGIRLWDKLLLCCSESSLSSWWVDNEIDEAFQKERDLFASRGSKVLVLIPLDLDGFLLDKWSSGKARQVLSRLTADFRGWSKRPEEFERAFDRLLNALRADSAARAEAPTPKL